MTLQPHFSDSAATSQTIETRSIIILKPLVNSLFRRRILKPLQNPQNPT